MRWKVLVLHEQVPLFDHSKDVLSWRQHHFCCMLTWCHHVFGL
jgi:hypothetical protein